MAIVGSVCINCSIMMTVRVEIAPRKKVPIEIRIKERAAMVNFLWRM